jgi:hypothetical protein
MEVLDNKNQRPTLAPQKAQLAQDVEGPGLNGLGGECFEAFRPALNADSAVPERTLWRVPSLPVALPARIERRFHRSGDVRRARLTGERGR